jgi:hypothetical protein
VDINSKPKNKPSLPAVGVGVVGIDDADNNIV